MRGHATCQSMRFVPPFEKRNDSALGVAIGDPYQLLRQPFIVGLNQPPAAHVIEQMPVKAGRNEDQLGGE